jgi:hypothetical protein
VGEAELGSAEVAGEWVEEGAGDFIVWLGLGQLVLRGMSFFFFFLVEPDLGSLDTPCRAFGQRPSAL